VSVIENASMLSMPQKKKEQGAMPCSKIVSTLFSRKVGFDLD
jgi:hypothetical protein